VWFVPKLSIEPSWGEGGGVLTGSTFISDNVQESPEEEGTWENKGGEQYVKVLKWIFLCGSSPAFVIGLEAQLRAADSAAGQSEFKSQLCHPEHGKL
jgi:hypothetical protein